MDVVGTAASIITLAETTKKLYDFWKAVDEAPPEVREIVEDLVTLKVLIERIEQEWTSQSIASAPFVDEVLKSCTNKINRLADMLNMFDFKNTRTWRQRKWSAIKATLKKEKIRDFQKSLEAAKTSLILAQSLLDSPSTSKLCRGITDLETKQSNVISTVVSQQTQIADIQNHVSEIRATSTHIIQAIEMQSAALTGSLVSSGLKALVSQAVQNALLDTEMQVALKSLFEKPQDLPPSNPVNRRVDLDAASEIEDHSAHRCLHDVTESICCNKQNFNAKTLRGQDTASSSLTSGESSIRGSIFSRLKPNFRRIVVQKHDRIYKSFCGSVYYYTELVSYRIKKPPESPYFYDASEEHRVETTLRIIPSSWLLRYGITISLTKSTNQISNSLRYFPIVPSDSPIFLYCERGDIQAVQSLFQRKLATPQDTDHWGWTPLHYATYHSNTQLCQMLLDNGADVDARNNFQLPPVISYTETKTARQRENAFQTMRIFMERSEIMTLDYCNLNATFLPFPAISWILRQEIGYFNPDFFRTYGQDLLDSLIKAWWRWRKRLRYGCYGYNDCEWNNTSIHQSQVDGILECLELLHKLNVDFYKVTLYPEIDRILYCHDSSPRLLPISWNENDTQVVRILISYGANLHGLNCYGHTLTITSLLHPQLFHHWRETLLGIEGFDLECFCADEIASTWLFRDWNWDKSALIQLFQLPLSRYKTLYHVDAGQEKYLRGYEAWWQMQIESCAPGGKWLEYFPRDYADYNYGKTFHRYFYLKELYSGRYCQKCSSYKIKLHSFSTSPSNIAITTRWGHWPCQWKRTIFYKEALKTSKAHSTCASNAPSIRRYDFLVSIWPSATNNPTPFFRYRRVRNYIVIYLRCWEWCSTILARMS